MARVMKSLYVNEDFAGLVDSLVAEMMGDHPEADIDMDTEWDTVEEDEEEQGG